MLRLSNDQGERLSVDAHRIVVVSNADRFGRYRLSDTDTYRLAADCLAAIIADHTTNGLEPSESIIAAYNELSEAF